MADGTTLDDLSEKLKDYNNTNEEIADGIHGLKELWQKKFAEEKRDEQKEKSIQKSKDKFKPKTSLKDNSNFFGALAHGDILRALFGLPVLGTGIVSMILGGIKLAYTTQEFFDEKNEKIKRMSDKLRSFLATGKGISLFFEKLFSTFTFIGSLSTKIPIIGAVFNSIAKTLNVFIGENSKIRRLISYFTGFRTLSGVLGTVGRFFQWILILDSAIKGMFAGVSHLMKSDSPLTIRIFEALAIGLYTAAKTFVKAFIDAIPLMLSGINWVFTDLMQFIENRGIPIVSDVAKLIRLSFGKFKEFLGVFENIYSWLHEFYLLNEDLFKTTSSNIISWLKEKGEQIFSFIGDFYSATVSFFSNIRDGFLDFIFKFDEATNGSLSFIMDKVQSGFNLIKDGIYKFLDNIMNFVKKLGVKLPDRMPWEEAKEDELNQRLKREREKEAKVDELERKSKERDKAKSDLQKASIIVTDASVRTSSTTVANQTNLAPRMIPNDRWHPAAVPDYHYSY